MTAPGNIISRNALGLGFKAHCHLLPWPLVWRHMHLHCGWILSVNRPTAYVLVHLCGFTLPRCRGRFHDIACKLACMTATVPIHAVGRAQVCHTCFGWNVRCVGVRGDAWSVMLSPCNTHVSGLLPSLTVPRRSSPFPYNPQSSGSTLSCFR